MLDLDLVTDDISWNDLMAIISHIRTLEEGRYSIILSAGHTDILDYNTDELMFGHVVELGTSDRYRRSAVKAVRLFIEYYNSKA